MLILLLTLPILIILRLRSFGLRLHSDVHLRYRYGMLYTSYKHNRYFWEMVLLYRRVTIIAIVSFVYDSMYEWLSFACLLCLFVQIYVHPCANVYDNNIEDIQLFLLTLLSILLSTNPSFPPSSIQQAFISLIVLAPLLTICVFVLFLKTKRTKTLDGVMNKQGSLEMSKSRERAVITSTSATNSRHHAASIAMVEVENPLAVIMPTDE
jgi:hypothetical protein